MLAFHGERLDRGGAAPPPPAVGARHRPMPRARDVEWRFYGGNLASQRYSPLDQIDASNAGQLKIAWRFNTGNYGPRPEARNETTPLMIDGVLYTQAGITRNVVAIDPKSGEMLWLWRPNDGEQRYARAPRKTSGRGLAYWTDGAGNERLFIVTPGFYLAALDPDTGRPVPGFGENGIVDLMVGVRGEVTDKSSIGNSSPPLVVGDVVIVGPAHEVGMRPPSKANLKGDVRGFDVHTGKLLWTFHTIPRGGEPGYETWLDGSAGATRATPAFGRAMTADRRARLRLSADRSAARGHLRRRAATATTSTAEPRLPRREDRRARLALPARSTTTSGTGTIPTRADPDGLVVDGRPIKAVAQLTKQAFVYTFDRVTGEPVWPIEERPVPQTDVPGEWTSPTQPFPTKPPPSIGRVCRGRPHRLHARAAAPKPSKASKAFRKSGRSSRRRRSPKLPTARRGTLMLPHATGGANWEGGAFDPETNVLYVGSFTNPFILRARAAARSDPTSLTSRAAARSCRGCKGLPLIKPPWGRITAIDMNKGEHLWQIASGPTPRRSPSNPALKGLDIPPTGTATRPVTLVTKTLLFTAEGWGANPVLRAHDKATGAVVAEVALPGAVGGRPMTYMIDGKQYSPFRSPAKTAPRSSR